MRKRENGEATCQKQEGSNLSERLTDKKSKKARKHQANRWSLSPAQLLLSSTANPSLKEITKPEPCAIVLWYSSLTKSSQGFTEAKENTDWQLDHGWHAGTHQMEAPTKAQTPATHYERDWEQGVTHLVPAFKVSSDRAQETHTKSTDAVQGSKQCYLGKQKWIAILGKAAQYSLYLNPPTLSEDTPMYLSLFFFAFFLSSRSRSSSWANSTISFTFWRMFIPWSLPFSSVR